MNKPHIWKPDNDAHNDAFREMLELWGDLDLLPSLIVVMIFVGRMERKSFCFMIGLG